MRNARKFFEAATVAAKAIRIMELEGGREGVKFFFNCFVIPLPLAEKPAVSVPAPAPPAPTHMPVVAAVVKPVQPIGPAPARTLEPVVKKTPAEHLAEWIGFLTQFLAGQKINPVLTCRKTTEVFSHRENLNGSMNREKWAIFFKALTKADEIGEMFHLIDVKANPSDVFESAPPDMAAEYCFGQDGLATKMAICLNELNGGEFPRWLAGKAGIFLDLVFAVSRNAPLDVHQIKAVENILDRLGKAGAPNGLVDDGREILARQTNTIHRLDPNWVGDERMAVNLANVQ